MGPRRAFASARVPGASAVVVTACVRYQSPVRASATSPAWLVRSQSSHRVGVSGEWKPGLCGDGSPGHAAADCTAFNELDSLAGWEGGF